MAPRYALVLPFCAILACTSPPRDRAPVAPAPPSSVNPPLAGTVAGNLVALQSRYGARGNFELIVPGARGGFLYYWRNNDDADVPWNGPSEIFADQGAFDAVAMAENGARKEEMDLLARQGDALYFLWRDADPQVPWHAEWNDSAERGLTPIASGIDGVPSLVAWSSGALDAVVPRRGGGLALFTRAAGIAQTPWLPSGTLGADAYAAVSLAKRANGGLALAARTGERIDLFTRAPGATWSAPLALCEHAAGAPALVERADGDLVLATPSTNGGIHLYTSSADRWTGPLPALGALGAVDAVSMFASNYSLAGNLEIVARAGARVFVTWSAADPIESAWAAPLAIVDAIDPIYPEPPAELKKSYTEYLGPLTGARTSDEAAVNLTGTDLGPAYEMPDGRLAFLFGDSRTVDRKGETYDSIAFTDATSVDRYTTPQLTWATRDGGDFFPFDPSGIDPGGMDVPVEGLHVDGHEYFFFSTDFHPFCAKDTCLGRHYHSALATTRPDDPTTIALVSDVKSLRFINVNAIAESDGYVYVYGSGFYRQSPVYLARALSSAIADRAQWTYYRGLRDGAPIWGPGELTSIPLFRCGVPVGAADQPMSGRHDNGIGEFSVRKHPNRPLYLMTYKSDRGCGGPNGVHLRSAHAPWGPWTAPTLILDKVEAHGSFVHASSDEQDPTAAVPIVDDGLARDHVDGVSVNRGGSFYGPYIIPRWLTTNGNADSIVFDLSSWNPYQVHLLRTVVTTDGSVVPRPNAGQGFTPTAIINGDFASGDVRGWLAAGDPFTVVRGPDGKPRATTRAPGGTPRVGQISQDFVVDGTVREIDFTMSGGVDASVQLFWRGELVRETTGRNDDEHELRVAWRLDDFRGQTLRLVVRNSYLPHNALTVSGFTFR